MNNVHTPSEGHAIARVGWLRAAVLGANDGIVSTGSLIVGVAASNSDTASILIAGVAALAAGAMSMAAGEYVSVSSQSDLEKADHAKERRELDEQPEAEREELILIYMSRGLTRQTASEVADQLTAADALGAHARDELGISQHTAARPLSAAATSALTFATGAAAPLLVGFLSPRDILAWTVAATSLVCLSVLGYFGAVGGGAPVGRSILRVTFWGTAAMILTAVIGYVFGTVAA